MSDYGQALSGAQRTAQDWADTIDRLIAAGQAFRAVDAVREAQAAFPDDLRLRLLGVLAWLRSGAVREARRQLAALEGRLQSQEGLLATLYGELWQRLHDPADLQRARDYTLAGLPAAESLTAMSAAAVMSWQLGETDRALDLAARALGRPQPDAEPEASAPAGSAPFRHHWARAKAALLLGHLQDALTATDAALAASDRGPMQRATARRDLQSMMAAGVPAPEAMVDRLPPPVVAICAGQGIDLPGYSGDASTPIFPPGLEPFVRRAIDEALEALGVEIGYVSAAAGAEILFVEALIDRGAEVNLMVPCDLDDFVAARVRPAGPGWERRFLQALRLASTVTVVNEERDSGDDVLFHFSNRVIDGSARLRAALLDAEPHLLVVWDFACDARLGGPADFIDSWGDPARLRLIDLDDIRERAGPLPAAGPSPASGMPTEAVEEPPEQQLADQQPRVVRAMLFADVVGFSALTDAQQPLLWRYLEQVGRHMAGHHRPPTLVDAWGDALFVVMPTAETMADYAFALSGALEALDSRDAGLPIRISLRMALHAGPVRPSVHPLTGRPMITGGHVNRAARIEAITVPGQIYASQQFMALLTAESSAARHEAAMQGAAITQRYRADYLGHFELPKRFGIQAIYHLQPGP